MAKKLQPLMHVDEFNKVLAASKPFDSMSLNLRSTAIEIALEFWLNNVVLIHPVTVSAVQHHRDGSTTIIIQPA